MTLGQEAEQRALATSKGDFSGMLASSWRKKSITYLQPPPPVLAWRAMGKFISQCFLGSAHWEL